MRKKFLVSQYLWLGVVAKVAESGISFTSESDIGGFYVTVPDVHEDRLKSILQAGPVFSVVGDLSADPEVEVFQAQNVGEARALFEQKLLAVECEDDPEYQSTCNISAVILGGFEVGNKHELNKPTNQHLLKWEQLEYGQ